MFSHAFTVTDAWSALARKAVLRNFLRNFWKHVAARDAVTIQPYAMVEAGNGGSLPVVM